MHRPKWMSPAKYAQFINRWSDASGVISCVGSDCSSRDDSRLTVDHIVPRSNNGTDDLSNLQPLCDVCNSRKGNRPDSYWTRQLYFDKPLVTSGLRVSQLDYIYNRILQFDEFFSRPYSAVNGKLFCFLQVVGAGKTLGMFTLPFALNRCVLERGLAAPRVDRMLIVTKDKALRRQTATELREESVRYGLVNEAPRVTEIERGDMLSDPTVEYDIAVMCPNMLWPQPSENKTGQEMLLSWPPNIERVLNRHPLIVFDEMHYAHRGIRLLIQAAHHSLVFGFTASPVNACGELLEDMVKMSVYTYHDAVVNDGSMKYLRPSRVMGGQRSSDRPSAGDDVRSAADFYRCLRVLTAKEQKILGGEWVTGTKLSGLPTVRSVVNGVIKQVYELDESSIVFDRDAFLYKDHWQHYEGIGKLDIVLTKPYYVHALVSVDGIETSNDVADYMNKVFNADRARYPKQAGWTAMAAHSRASLPLDRNHPFFRYRDTLRIDSTCCCFLIVDSLAVEGMNNRFLAIWGAAEVMGSIKEAIQRLGRPLRSAAVWNGQVLLVPPASHDRVYVITHAALVSNPNALGVVSNTAETIEAAIDFLTDMYAATEDIMTIEEYVALEVAPAASCDIDRDGQLSRWARCELVQAIGELLMTSKEPDINNIVKRFGGAAKLRRNFVRAYAESLLAGVPTSYQTIHHGSVMSTDVDALEDLKSRILRIRPPESTDVLDEERPTIERLDEDAAEAWLSMSEWGKFFKRKWKGENDPEWLSTVNSLYCHIEGSFNKYEFDIRQSPASRMMQLVDEINQHLGTDADTAQRVRDLVLEGVTHYLQRLTAAQWVDFEPGGRYCRPSVTFALRNELFVSQLGAWICFVLLKEGRLSKVAAALRFERFWEKEDQLDPPST